MWVIEVAESITYPPHWSGSELCEVIKIISTNTNLELYSVLNN
jgi:hypothetical protein